MMKYAYNFTQEELFMLRDVFTAAKFGINAIESKFHENWRDEDNCPIKAAQALSKKLNEQGESNA